MQVGSADRIRFGYELPRDSQQLADLLNKIFIDSGSEENKRLQEFLKKACGHIKNNKRAF